jgi:chromosome partitioning protein
VLLIDLDPQASLTLALGTLPAPAEAEPARPAATAYDLLLRSSRGQAEPFAGAIQPTASGLWLTPASIELSAAEIDLVREPLGVFALRDCLDTVPGQFDYVLLDCPPSLGILTANALAAASGVIIPLQADYLALRGVDLLLNTIAKMQKRANPHLAVLAILLTLADLRTLHAREVIAAARATFGERVPVLEEVVPFSVRVKEAPLAQASILEYASDSPAAAAYRKLAEFVDP